MLRRWKQESDNSKRSHETFVTTTFSCYLALQNHNKTSIRKSIPFHLFSINKPSITNRTNLSTSEALSDNESEQSVPEVLSRTQKIEFNEGDLLTRNSDFETKTIIEHSFSDMGRQIGELPNIMLSLTERLSSNTREVNGLNTSSTESSDRFDTTQDSLRIHTVSKTYRKRLKNQPKFKNPENKVKF